MDIFLSINRISIKKQPYQFMDNMMGGKGSESLATMHRRMGYNYLAGEESYDSHMMGWGRRGSIMGPGMMRNMMGPGMIGGYWKNDFMVFPFG